MRGSSISWAAWAATGQTTRWPICRRWAYIARRGGQGWLYGNGERFTAICDGGEITLTAGRNSVFSVFCLGADAEGVTIENAKYPLTDAVLTADFPLGVSNHFIGQAVRVAVRCGCLLIGITDKE